MISFCGGASSVALHLSLRASLSGMCAIHWNDGDAPASPVPLPRESGGLRAPSVVDPFRGGAVPAPFPGVFWLLHRSGVSLCQVVCWPEPLGWFPFREAASLGAVTPPLGSVPSGPGAPRLGRPRGFWPPMWGWACAIPPFLSP